MAEEQKNNPLHGITLEQVVTALFELYGWDELANLVNINSFKSNPSIKSSLSFLRKTPWAREKVERLYITAIAKGRPPRKRKPSAPATSSVNSNNLVNPWAKHIKPDES